MASSSNSNGPTDVISDDQPIYDFDVKKDTIIVKNKDEIYDTIRFEKKLQTGSFGVVFKGFSTRLNKTIAIKRTNRSSDPMKKIILENEIFILINITKMCEKYFVCIYYVGKDANSMYIVMEFIDGYDMMDLIQQPLVDANIMRKAICSLVTAINMLHKNNIVHGDIKLENMMYDKNTGNVKLIDFGLACLADSVNNESSDDSEDNGLDYFDTKNDHRCRFSAGSLATMAPEIVLFKSVISKRTDVWSLGVVIFLLVLKINNKDDKIREYLEYYSINYKSLGQANMFYLQEIIEIYLQFIDSEFKAIILEMCQFAFDGRQDMQYVENEIKKICKDILYNI